MITDEVVESAAKRIARTVPLGCGGGWNEPHGHDFPLQYSDKEQRLIRGIAKDALTAALGDAVVVPDASLVQRCRELLDWSQTGLLNGGGVVRDLAARLEAKVGETYALRVAEDQTKDDAMRAVVRIAEALAVTRHEDKTGE